MKLLIAGGGTGGHLFPGIALAEEMMTRQPNQNDVLFVGTERGLETRIVPQNNFKLEMIDVSGLKGVGWWRRLLGLLRLPRALWQSLQIIRRYRPDVVVGVGGYASGPMVLMAWLSGIPTAVQEQNALPGMTNRWLGRLAHAIFTAFPEATRYFPASRVQMLGNPIRRALMDNFLKNTVPHDQFNLLVFGGSQGSHLINRTLIEALPYLEQVRSRVHILHQTGPREVEEVRQGYARAGANAEVVEFIHDMSAAYAQVDAIVCRAGAITLAEITVAKKAAILIPFAAAADNHQEVNARSLVEAGAAVMILEKELSAERLAKEIFALMNPARRQQMERQAGVLGRPQAAKEIADVLTEMVAMRQEKLHHKSKR